MSEHFQPFNQGQDSVSPVPNPSRPNGVISFYGTKKELWINNIQTGFSLEGSTANSYRTRSFFAKNFSQPSIVVQCQFSDQSRMAEFTEFIRHAQVGFGITMRLDVLDRYSGPKVYNNQRGPGSDISALGYVKSVPRVHAKFVFAPTLSFEFSVSKMLFPTSWADEGQGDVIKFLPSWKDIVMESLKK